MNLVILLDTHALLWWLHEPPSLSRRVREAVEDGGNRVLVSPVSAFEIATKSRKGKLEFDSPLAGDFTEKVLEEGFEELPISCEHARLAGSLDDPHNDPWDRLLAAQARTDGILLATCDERMARLGAAVFW